MGSGACVSGRWGKRGGGARKADGKGQDCRRGVGGMRSENSAGYEGGGGYETGGD